MELSAEGEQRDFHLHFSLRICKLGICSSLFPETIGAINILRAFGWGHTLRIMWHSPWHSLETDSGLDVFFFKNGTKSILGQAKGQSFLVSLTMAVADA